MTEKTKRTYTKCTVCGKRATKGNESSCPYGHDLHGDDTPVYFWCKNPACAAEVDRLCMEASHEL